jgi:hypothetical protein
MHLYGFYSGAGAPHLWMAKAPSDLSQTLVAVIISRCKVQTWYP